jgi:hypothetical protein
LLNQMGRYDDNDGGFVWLIQQMLSNDYTGFDRLAQANFIGEQVPLDGVGQNSPHCRNLVFEKVHRCGRKPRESAEGSPLVGKVPHKPRASVEEERSVGDTRRQVVRRILNRMCPTNVELRNRNVGVVSVREPDRVVVLGSLQRLGADQPSVHAARTPCVSILVKPQDAGLRREFDFAHGFQWRLNLVETRPDRRFEILDVRLFPLDVQEFANTIGTLPNMYESGPCQHSDDRPSCRKPGKRRQPQLS